MRRLRPCLLHRTFQQAIRTSHSISTTSLRSVPILQDGTVTTFQDVAFKPAMPALLPRAHFDHLPARDKWFQTSESTPELGTTLNKDYLCSYSEAIVPLEVTDQGQFNQVQAPLSFFLEAATQAQSSARIYLAQVDLADLPPGLSADVPTPTLVLSAGKGDIYSSSIWLGAAPTYTPLHRDPNPNLFVQLAGRKRVRLFSPEAGAGIFAQVQREIGGRASATMRGSEMMEGAERRELESMVWEIPEGAFWEDEGWECEVGAGDGLFIPKGWWHSVKGIGQGMTGSVNWWFR